MEETSTDGGTGSAAARLAAVLESIQSYHHRPAPVIDTDNELPGLRFLRDEVKRGCCETHPTNAPYLVAVWDELVHADHPVALYRTFDKIKVDVVAEGGARWVRVNAIKNARLMMEFREMDSYLASDDDDDEMRPRLSKPELDNSVLRMGGELLAAARANTISTGPSIVTPQVTMRLTRLDPCKEPDPRFERTIQSLRDMGIDVQLGPRPHPASIVTRKPLEPTTNINLDLSALIALVSDTSHSPLPRTDQEAYTRFKLPYSYLDWKRGRIKSLTRQDNTSYIEDALGMHANSHSRALVAQAIREMNKEILQEVHDRAPPSATFWTTSEARLRCIQIVSKIGGQREKQRADAMLGSTLCTRATQTGGLDNAREKTLEDTYWEHSRYPVGFLPIVPIRVYPSVLPLLHDDDQKSKTTFFDALARTCTEILSHDTASVSPPSATSSGEPFLEEFLTVQTSVPKLAVHTATSMLAGASRGHTTLTMNKASVKAALKEMQRVRVRHGYGSEMADSERASLWILDPRSLSEGMCSE